MEALSTARRARAAAAAETQQTRERLRLLEAEILIRSQKESEALALLASPLAQEASTLAARQAMLTGMALLRQGHWPAGKERLERALTTAQQSGDRSTEAMAGVQLASGLAALGQWTEAASALQRAAIVADSVGDPYLSGIVVRANQASLMMRRGDPERSNELYRAVAAESERAGDLVTATRALDNMAINYQQLGDFERALEYNARALQVLDKLDLPDSRMQAHGFRGRLLYLLDRPEEAAAELERALGIARQRTNADQIRRWSDNLAPVLLDLNRIDDAERLTEESLKADPHWSYSLATRGLVNERRSRVDEARSDWETVVADQKCPNDVRRDAWFGLARLAVAINDRPAARHHYRAALQLVDRAWDSLLTDDSRLTFLTGAMAVYRSYVAALVRWGDDAEALRIEESSRARLLGDHHGPTSAAAGGGVSFASLSRLASRSGAVFLAYWLAPGGGSHVRLIAPGHSELVPLSSVDPREITRLVREHNDLVQHQIGDPRETGTAALRLYELLIKPLETRIPAGSRVVIIPDGDLHRLNFETLVRVKDGRKGFWIEDVTVQVAPSLSLLNEETVGPAATQRLLLMGDALAAPDFDRLEHAGAEMKMIRDIFGAQAVTELSGAAAKPTAYAAASPGAHTHIHFTAHAKADHESPLDSAVILTPEPSADGAGIRYRLLAREVAGIALHADLVTVSACRSAGDRAILGEGMVGFAWAFLRAGASHVVAGLWDVNDRSTAKLMGEFYTAVHAGKPVTEALRDAKLSFIAEGKNYAKPYYWAPFQVYSRSLTRRR